MPATAQCALINLAMRQLERTGSVYQGRSSDSSRVARAGIYEWRFVGEKGEVVNPYVTVELCLLERPYNAVLYLYSDGSTKIVRSHKGPHSCARPGR
jgi:hypothetical protein